jgi:hypothetical protein
MKSRVGELWQQSGWVDETLLILEGCRHRSGIDFVKLLRVDGEGKATLLEWEAFVVDGFDEDDWMVRIA